MNSTPNSPNESAPKCEPKTQQLALMPEPTPTSPGELVFEIEIPGRLPSWNQILGFEHWSRDKFKCQLQEKFMYELRRLESASSTKTTAVANSISTYCATLELFLETRRQKRKLRSAKKRQSREQPNLSESKFSKSKVPF